MRFDTHRISAQLVNELQKGRPHLEVTYDGGDLIRVSLESNEIVQIYLIENPITVYEIRGIVAANTAVGVYSCSSCGAICCCRCMARAIAPTTGWRRCWRCTATRFTPSTLTMARRFYIFPVYFEGTGAERSIRHGTAIDATQLVGETIITRSPLIAGRLARGELRGAVSRTAKPTRRIRARSSPRMTIYFQRLGFEAECERAAVKRAYRRLARKYHPDLNTDPSATMRMQQINEAYQRILEELDQAGWGNDG